MLRFAFTTFLAVFVNAALPADGGIAGEWVSYTNNGGGTTQEGKCITRKIEERRYNLFPASGGGYTGIYASIWHVRWLRRDSDDCTYPGLPPKQAYMGNRTWNVEVLPQSSNNFKIKAAFDGCRGDVCSFPGLFQGEFETYLSFDGGRLIDGARDQKDLAPMTFAPITAAQRETTTQAHEFMRSWRRMPQDESSVKYVTPMVLEDNFRDEELLRRTLRHYYAARLKNSTGYQLIEAYQLDVGPKSWPKVPILHFAISNQQKDGTNLGETFELARANGQWKLLSFRY